MPTQSFKHGGTLDLDAKSVKEYFAGGSGQTGGVLVGKRHSEGGIKAINKATGQPIEMEGGEVVITRDAVSDNTKREFEGEMLTNKEILSRINQSGGGVAIFEEGGHVCNCTGTKYNYGGKVMEDYDILREMAKYRMTDAEYAERRKADYRVAEKNVMEDGGVIRKYTDSENWLLHEFKTGQKVVSVDCSKIELFDGLLEDKIIYFDPSPNGICQDARLTPKGKRLIGEHHVSTFARGGKMDCGCGKYKEGGKTDGEKTYFRGFDYNYANQYDLNKAIEEYLAANPDKTVFTSEEKSFVGSFAGYGGLIKFGAEGKGILYEYYTPMEIVRKMWALAYKHGYNGGKVLEPSVGTGNFLKYAPKQAMTVGYEINPVSAKICRILYPQATIRIESFETLFIKRNASVKGDVANVPKFDLVIGNPPYGEYESFYAGMGEKKYTRSYNWIDYFITRGLDCLQSGGLLIFIIGGMGKPWLALDSPVKEMISEKAILLDAYRLPNGLFDNTEVQTDIIVLKKR